MVIAGLAVGSAFYNGVPGGNDFNQHYQFASATYDSLYSGQLVPGLAPLANNGLGDYGIRIYPPFSYYFISLIFGITGSWYFASLIMFLLVFWISGIGTYLWAREDLPPREALLAGGLFIFAPYHLSQLYNTFLFAEITAYAFVPFCFLFITRICKKGRVIDIAGLSVAYAILILTHLPSIIICSIAFGVYSAVLLYGHKEFFKTAFKLFVSVLLALSASSFYWIKVITELKWTNHASPKYFADIYGYKANFLLNPQNFLNFWDDVRALWIAELMILSVLLVSIPSFIYFVRNRRSNTRFTIAVFAVFLVSVFLTSGLSELVWHYVPPLEKVQFPWRWLAIVSLCGAVFASGGILKASDFINKNKNWLVTISLGFVLVIFVTTSFVIAKQGVFVSRDEFTNQDVRRISKAKSCECWWTVWAKSPALDNKSRIGVANRDAEIVRWQPFEKEIVFKEGAPAVAETGTFYYPYWHVLIDGKPGELSPSENGLIKFSVPGSSARVLLIFQEPPIIVAARYLSLLIGTILFLLMLVPLLRPRTSTRPI